MTETEWNRPQDGRARKLSLNLIIFAATEAMSDGHQPKTAWRMYVFTSHGIQKNILSAERKGGRMTTTGDDGLEQKSGYSISKRRDLRIVNNLFKKNKLVCQTS